MDMGRWGKGVGLLAVCGHGTLWDWIRKGVAGELLSMRGYAMGKTAGGFA